MTLDLPCLGGPMGSLDTGYALNALLQVWGSSQW